MLCIDNATYCTKASTKETYSEKMRIINNCNCLTDCIIKFPLIRSKIGQNSKESGCHGKQCSKKALACGATHPPLSFFSVCLIKKVKILMLVLSYSQMQIFQLWNLVTERGISVILLLYIRHTNGVRCEKLFSSLPSCWAVSISKGGWTV